MTHDRLHRILWFRVWSLAIMQGSISLCWLFYKLYLPELLTQFDLSATMASRLLVIESAIAILMEPLMGSLSDQAQQWVGTRLPFIAAGVVAAASLLVALPAIVILGQPTPALKLVLLITTVAWAMAMAVFRSPVLSLLGQSAAVPSLPIAFSVLSLVGGGVGALRPLATDFILSLGPALAFTIAACSLLGGAMLLRAVHPPRATVLLSDYTAQTNCSLLSLGPTLGWLALTGLGMAWGVQLLLGEIIPKLLRLLFATQDTNLGMGIVLLSIGALALPLALLARRWSNWAIMLVGVGSMVLGLLLSLFPIAGFALIDLLLLTIAAGSLLNGVIPLALSVVPDPWGGLGIGTYFGGFSAAMALLGAISPTELAAGWTIAQALLWPS